MHPDQPSSSAAADRAALANIRKLELKANSGFWALALFTAVSIAAYRGFGFLAFLLPLVEPYLGTSPPVNLINWALSIYGFAAIILILTRMAQNIKPHGAFTHVGYLGAFYLFYFLAGGLKDNFWAVFAAGMTILGLHGYHLWTYFQEIIQHARELLAGQDRHRS